MVKDKVFLRRLLQPYRLRLALLSIMMVLQAALQVSMALLAQLVIDAAVAGSEKLPFWSVLLAVDLGLQVILYAIMSWHSSSTTDRLTVSMQNRLLRSAVYSSDARLQAYHSGALLSRCIEDVDIICDGIVHAMPALVGQGARLIGAFIALLLIHHYVALILLLAGILLAVSITLLRPVLRVKQRAVRNAEENVMSTMQEELQQLELIQSMQIQEPIADRFGQTQRKSLKEKRKRRLWSVGAHSLVNLASVLGTGAMLLWGAANVASGALSYGSLTAMLQLLSQFRGPVLSLSGLWTRLTAVEVAAERLSLLMEIPEQPEDQPAMNPRYVVFENVTFRYPGDESSVVENFSLTLPLEGWASLSGISGRGKTTLFKLILGLYTPQSGRVYLQTEKGELPCSVATRHLFAYVPQDYALFSGTILDNLRLVAPEAGEDRCLNALQVAAAEFVAALPNGLQTNLGENNTGLSKGQLQRIAIARAVLMDRKVLLLDECTSALDAETERRVLHNLYKTCPNALLVTHRPQALESLERITPVTMDN